ncbi:hypothetical protein [Pseudomonas sp. UM16]|uniref:hypothetical protein n=1 Tax=Pseudomonas sp. UM16 TaxID=3158962 RepID=UPI0039901DA8
MKGALGLIAAAVLATGCTWSVEEAREKGPLETYRSVKDQSDLAKCTLFAWQNDSLAGTRYRVFLQPRPGGGETVLNDFNRELADFYRVGSETRIDFFSNVGRPSYVTERRIKSIEGCL